MKKGLLLVISGPSGTGKGTICNEILKKDDNLSVSVSCTTRKPRPGEKEGISYYYKSHEEFRAMIEENGFLEYAQVFDNYYGTPVFGVEEKRNAGKDVILEIDVQGALNVKKIADDAILIFIAPPSVEELSRRLRKRNSETEEQIALRLSRVESEMKLSDKYDYIVVNGALETAVEDVLGIIAQERNK